MTNDEEKLTLSSLHDEDDVLANELGTEDQEDSDDPVITGEGAQSTDTDDAPKGNDIPEGKSVKLGEDGEPVLDEQGNPVLIDIPEPSGIEAYLSNYGIEGGMITFEAEEPGGEPVRKHFDDLTEAEKGTILLQLAESGVTPIEKKYDLDEDEIGFLNYARKQNKPINEVIEELTQKRLDELRLTQEISSVDFENMSSDAIYARWIKESNPDATDEDIESELNTAKESKFFQSNVERIKIEFINNQKLEIEKAAF